MLITAFGFEYRLYTKEAAPAFGVQALKRRLYRISEQECSWEWSREAWELGTEVLKPCDDKTGWSLWYQRNAAEWLVFLIYSFWEVLDMCHSLLVTLGTPTPLLENAAVLWWRGKRGSGCFLCGHFPITRHGHGVRVCRGLKMPLEKIDTGTK